MIIRKYWSFIVVLILSYFSISPLFISGFFPMHDDTQVARVFEMGKALGDGMFPVRWVKDLGYGYGYPIFNFYAPLAYYVGGFLNFVGFDALISAKIMISVGIISSGIFMYFLAKEFWGAMGGLISAIFYVYAPYHALDIYVRGAVGELYAYALIPLMFLGCYKVCVISSNSKLQFKIKNFPWKWITLGSLGYAGVILSHNLTVIMITPFLLIILLVSLYITVQKKQLSIFSSQFSILILGIFLSAFYWLPALFEMQYTNVLSQIGGGADFRNHFVCLNQLWESQWGLGGSIAGCLDGMSFKIGKAHIILSLVAVLTTIIIFIRKKFQPNHYNNMYYYSEKFKLILLLTLGLLASILLTLEISKPLWESISFMAFLQYPWRFLLLTSFFTSLLSGSLIWFLEKSIKNHYLNTVFYLSIGILIFILLYFNLKLFQPQTILNKNVIDYSNDYEIKWRVSKISDEYLPKDFIKPNSKDQIVNKRLNFNKDLIVVNHFMDSTQNIIFNIDVLTQTKIQINLANFPAWKIYVNGKEQSNISNNKGYELLLFKGKNLINVRFAETPIEKLANLISLISILGLIIGIIYYIKQSKLIYK